MDTQRQCAIHRPPITKMFVPNHVSTQRDVGCCSHPISNHTLPAITVESLGPQASKIWGSTKPTSTPNYTKTYRDRTISNLRRSRELMIPKNINPPPQQPLVPNRQKWTRDGAPEIHDQRQEDGRSECNPAHKT